MSSIVKRLVIGAAALGVVVVAAQTILPALVPTEQAQQKLKEGLEQAGFTLAGNVSPSVSLASGVRLSFPDLEIQGVREQLKPITIKAGELVATLPFSALWGDFTLQEVYLNNAAITYTRSEEIRADAADAATEKAEPMLVHTLLLLSSIESPAYDLRLSNGSLRVDQPGAVKGGTPQATELTLDLLRQTEGWSLRGRGNLRGQSTELSITNQRAAEGAHNVQFDLKNAVVTLSYNGSRNAATPPLIQGKVLLEAADTSALYALFSGESTEDAAAVAAADASEKPKGTEDGNNPLNPILPPGQEGNANPKNDAEQIAALAPKAGAAARFVADIFYRQGQVVAKNMELSVPGVAVKGEAGGSIQAPYNVQANLVFQTLNSNAFVNLGGLVHESWLPALISTGLDAKANARVLVKAANVEGLVKGEQLNGLLTLENGTAQISQFSMQAPGKSVIGFDGTFAVTPQGPTLIGQINGQGEEFNAFFPAITSMPLTLPQEGFRSFAFASDIRLSPEDVRLTNLRAKIGNTVVNMAYIHQLASRDTGVRLAISGLNADALLESKAAEGMKFQRRKGENATQAHVLPPYVQDLLLGLRANYNIYLYAENYIYDGRPGDPLEVRLRASRGRLNLEQFTTRLSGADISFNGFVDIGASVPKFKLDLQFGDLDVGRLQEWLNDDAQAVSASQEKALPAEINVSAEGTRWSNKALNWNFIPLAEGAISIKASRVLHPALTLTNANIRVSLSNEQLTMEESTANLFNADLLMKGQMTGGALPTWQTSFSIANLEVAEMQRLFPWLQSVQGRLSISGAAASSGASLLAHVRNLKANLAMTGRAIQINEFDLAAAVDALRKLTTVDDLKHTLNITMPKSNTRFESMEALLEVAGGNINISRMWLKSPRFVGEITGSGSLLNWVLDTRVRFPLSVLEEKNPPEVVLIGKGTPDSLAISRDDRSLEQYVVQKTANELIQGR